MIPELGHFSLILALAMALLLAVVPLAGTVRGVDAWTAVARPAAWGQLLFLALSFALLTAADQRDPALLAKLDAVAGRVLGRG